MFELESPHLTVDDQLVETIGLVSPSLKHYTEDHTRFYIERMLQLYPIELMKHFQYTPDQPPGD